MVHLVFLPATEPGDTKYGTAPDWIEALPVAVHHVCFPTMVWYNEAVRLEAVAQIRSMELDSAVLVGFSKSGLGAWHIAQTLPDLISGTIVFDAPVARNTLPPWRTAPFYGNDRSWQADLPMRTISRFVATMPESYRLVLVSGASFHEEMSALAQALSGTPLRYVFLPRPHLKHHWRSGWLEEGLGVLLGSAP